MNADQMNIERRAIELLREITKSLPHADAAELQSKINWELTGRRLASDINKKINPYLNKCL